MHHKSIYFVLGLVLFLGLLFQYNRQDGFLHLLKNTNDLVLRPVQDAPADVKNLAEETLLLVYDPLDGDSLRIRANVERTLRYMHKAVRPVSVQGASSFEGYSGVIVTASRLDRIVGSAALRQYIQQGGSLYVLASPALEAVSPEWAELLGWQSVDEQESAYGLKMESDLLLGAKGLELSEDDMVNSSLHGELRPGVKVHAKSQDEVPLLWEQPYGQGRVAVCNGNLLSSKENRGVIAGLLSLGKEPFLYPVAGIRMVHIDDFPAPVPNEKHEKIYQEYRLEMPDFYRQIWWPDMLKAAERYDIKYTGLIIESYNKQISGPFSPEKGDGATRNNLVIYGRELLRHGGELGIHGYNHQPLVLSHQQKHMRGFYETWPGQEPMAESLRELKRYVAEAYPDYQLRVYVPPSNILGPEGRAAVKEVFPDLHIVAAIFSASDDPEAADSYLQEFERGPDGILNMPRISADYVVPDYNRWSLINAINYLGIFSHFIHPDNIYYEENGQRSWREMYEGLDGLLRMVHDQYGWLRSCTMSQGGELVDDYLNLNYRVQREPERIRLHAWGFRQDAFFVLRSRQNVKYAEGAQVQKIGDQAYLVKLQRPEALIYLAAEATQ